MKQNSCRKRYPSGVCLQEWFEPGRITAPGFVIGTVGWGLCIGSGPEGGAPGQMQASIAFPRFESIDAPINLVLRSAHVILRRACPTWGARLEGLRESRRTATSETEPAAILRDGAPQVGSSRLAYLMCRSRVNPRSVRLLRMRSVGLSSIARSDWLHGIDLLAGLPEVNL